MASEASSIDLNHLTPQIQAKKHQEYPTDIETIRFEATHGELGKIASLKAWRISRAHCRGSFLTVMDDKEETQKFSFTLFDQQGNVRPHLIDAGCYRSGTGCWGQEMNSGELIYIFDIRVQESYRGQGVGTWTLLQFLGSQYVQSEDIVTCWPAPGSIRDKDRWTAVRDMQIAFFRKNHFRRIGRTPFFGYSPKSNHPSRSIPVDADVDALGDKFQNAASADSRELLTRFPLHAAIARDRTENIATIIQTFYDDDPTSIHKADDMGCTPISVAAGIANVFAIRKLLEWDLGADLENAANAEGVTPLERLEDTMRMEREFSKVFQLEWSGPAHDQLSTEYFLKKAMGQIGDEHIQEYISKRNPRFTCRHCSGCAPMTA